jgi:hypothetical protein
MTRADIEQDIAKFIPLEKFVRIEERLAFLRKEEEQKLLALGELQKAYVAANSDAERDMVKITVGKIRELSRATRTEIRSLNQELIQHLPLEQAHKLYQDLLAAHDQSPK